jgi:hypothetical protein
MHGPTTATVAAHNKLREPRAGLLEPRALLVTPGGKWCLKVTPAAGEATITHAPCAAGRVSGVGTLSSSTERCAPYVSSATRAKGKVRRYCRANRLRFLWTLTYATEPATRAEVTAHLRTFFRRLRTVFGRMPLLVVIERGTTTDRLHVHFAAGRFLSIEGVRRCWPHGFVHVGDPRKLAGRVPVRRLAAYLSKYVSKQADAEAGAEAKDRAEGEHRYLVTQGYTPKSWSLRYQRVGQAYERLLGLYGAPDVERDFGDWDKGLVFGIWYAFPDHLLHPPPGTLDSG